MDVKHDMKSTYLFWIIIGCIFSNTATTFSQESTVNFKVSLTVQETCALSSEEGTLDFGTIQRAQGDTTAHNNLNIQCTDGTPYSISLKSHRNMSNSQQSDLKIPYELYQDSNYDHLWVSDNTNNYQNTGTGSVQVIPIWGKVLSTSTNVPAGHYLDTVTAKITY